MLLLARMLTVGFLLLIMHQPERTTWNSNLSFIDETSASLFCTHTTSVALCLVNLAVSM